MSISFGLGVNLGVSQKLTPQMQQAIKLLQMSSLELEQEVQAKLDSNPMLERQEDFDDESKSSESASLEDWNSASWEANKANTEGFEDDFEGDGNDSFDKLDSPHLDNDAIDSQWQDVYDDGYHADGGALLAQTPDDESDFLGVTTLCIQDYVRWQMSFKPLSEIQKLIAEHLIDAMDDLGFIRLSVDDLMANFATVLGFYGFDDGITRQDIEEVVQEIQTCSPTGVGARDLAECLLLQVNELPKDTEFLTQARLVLAAAEHIQSNNIKALMQETGLDGDDIKAAIALIRTLDPSPAASFVNLQNAPSEKLAQDVPDILVVAKSPNKAGATTTWQVMLNPDTLPRLKINQEYANLVKRGDESPDNVYLKNNLADARLFIRSIEERNHNLLKVATCIVQKQQAFLTLGARAMQPLTLRDVAEIVELHESTVSRLTSNKTMLTPQGLYPLKYFFSSYVLSSEGEVSSTAISAMITEMIANENPKKPLSDSELTRRLEAKGVEIARRTVTKYREAMNIGSSTQRKQKI